MELAGNGLRVNFDLIPVDEFWNVGYEIEHKMHRIHAYPAKFPAFITTKAIQYAEERNISVKTVADVFCGCGTTSYEACRNNKKFWGCDINPVATLIAQVKSKKYKDETLLKYFEDILKLYESSDVNLEHYSINERITYWYSENQIQDLIRLKTAIESTVPPRSHYLKFFLCAFSNILKGTSFWLTKSIKPQTDPNKKPAEVIKAFKYQFKFMREANLTNDLSPRNQVKIETVSFLERNFHKPFVDLLITSPPYVTSYEYADLHQLSTLWLGYTEDYTSLRKGTIGSLFRSNDFNNDIKNLNNTGENIVFQLWNVDKKKARAAARYYLDMQKSVKKCYKILNNNGMALFVIGNTEFKGVKMNNALHLIESMKKSGFSDIDIVRRKISNKNLPPHRDEIGRFTNDKNSRKIYAEEYIVIGRKYE